MTRIEFLREQTVTGKNKSSRAPLPNMSVADEPVSLFERKALGLKKIFDTMPIYIGPRELIVGTRTYFTPSPGNEDGHDNFAYSLPAGVTYVNSEDIARFGCNQSYINMAHSTPDFSIILEKGIGGILCDIKERQCDASLGIVNLESLSAMSIAYTGLSGLICRYADKALDMANKAIGSERDELLEISRICRKISFDKPESFREAVQLLWFAHLGTIIESFEFINYGRLDVILEKYLGDISKEEALEIIECLLLKMYDQADVVYTYLGKYAAQLVITLGGVLPNGENAVNDVTMLFLDAIDVIRLPEPEFNLRINSKNPPEFLNKAAKLTVSGCNFISYYNDDLFIKSLNGAGIPIEHARNYAFDLCQDVHIPGAGAFFVGFTVPIICPLIDILKAKRDFESFDDLVNHLKKAITDIIDDGINRYNAAEAHVDLYANGRLDEYFDLIKKGECAPDRKLGSPMAPLPLLSGMYHGCIENALDYVFRPFPLKDIGSYIGTVTETINSLAALKKTVFDNKYFTLDEIWTACESDFECENGKYIQSMLLGCPKWGNDDDYVDLIAKDLLEFSLRECEKHKTHLGGQVLGGIHTPHPIPTGYNVMATPDGKRAKVPVAVSMSPHNGTAKCGPTATLLSASKLDPMLIQWNYCVMVNYFSSVFNGNDGHEIFKSLLNGYFKAGGMQHQPNISNVEDLKKAQSEPDKYKDLIVRLWGVSAHFVDLPKELQDEMIARFS